MLSALLCLPARVSHSQQSRERRLSTSRCYGAHVAQTSSTHAVRYMLPRCVLRELRDAGAVAALRSSRFACPQASSDSTSRVPAGPTPHVCILAFFLISAEPPCQHTPLCSTGVRLEPGHVQDLGNGRGTLQGDECLSTQQPCTRQLGAVRGGRGAAALRQENWKGDSGDRSELNERV